MVLEACVENIDEALQAQRLGADRIELCDNLAVGGTTPSAGTIAVARKLLDIPIMVLIRPRGGNFVYSEHEIAIMRHDIDICKNLGVHGIVIGTLTHNNEIDVDLINDFVQYAKPLEITFHKAIDETTDIRREVQRLLTIDIDRLLTSGGAESAFSGIDTINEMIDISKGKIQIIAAGNLDKGNLSAISSRVHTCEFHGKKIVGSLNGSDT